MNDLHPGTSGTLWSEGFWLNGQWFPIIQGAAEDSAGDGDGTSSGNDDASSGEQDDKSGDEDSADEEKKFTQKQVQDLITKEVQRAVRGKLNPKDLGFTSAKELQEALEAAKAQEEEMKDAETKALEEAIAETRKQVTEEVMDAANARLVRAEFKVQAVSHGVEYEDDAFAIAQGTDLWQGVDIDDDGNVVGFDDAFFEGLKEAKPYLFKAETPAGGQGGADAGAGNSGDRKQTRADELAKLYGGPVKDSIAWAKSGQS